MAVTTVTRSFWSSRPARIVGIFVGLVGLCAALTILFWAMRSVMEIGGSCASGNVPYENVRPCPKGTGWLMTTAIFGGLLMLAIYALSAAGGPNLWPLAWPALFLSLGWNFLEYGVDPPFGSGVSPGWLICGVVFVLMGGLPLVALIRSGWLTSLFTGREATGAGSWLPKAPSSDTNTLVLADVPRAGLLAVQAVAIVVGIWAGWRIFDWGNG